MKKLFYIFGTVFFVFCFLFIAGWIWLYVSLCKPPEYRATQSAVWEQTADTELWEKLSVTRSEIPANNKQLVVNFDVSDSGNVALALNKWDIMVFDQNGYKYTFSFEPLEYKYLVFWDKENLCLYLDSDDKVVEFTLDGELVEIGNVDLHNEFEIKTYARQLQRKSGNYIYSVEKDFGFFNYFLSEDEYVKFQQADVNDDSVAVLFDCGKYAGMYVLKWFVFFVAFISATIVMFILFVTSSVKESKAQKSRKDNGL